VGQKPIQIEFLQAEGFRLDSEKLPNSLIRSIGYLYLLRHLNHDALLRG
jgi:hypothetical protein